MFRTLYFRAILTSRPSLPLQLQLKKQSAWARESERLLDIVEGKAPVTDDLITSSSAAHIGKVRAQAGRW